MRRRVSPHTWARRSSAGPPHKDPARAVAVRCAGGIANRGKRRDDYRIERVTARASAGLESEALVVEIDLNDQPPSCAHVGSRSMRASHSRSFYDRDIRLMRTLALVSSWTAHGPTSTFAPKRPPVRAAAKSKVQGSRYKEGRRAAAGGHNDGRDLDACRYCNKSGVSDTDERAPTSRAAIGFGLRAGPSSAVVANCRRTTHLPADLLASPCRIFTL